MLAPWLAGLAASHVSPTSYVSFILHGSFTLGKLGVQEVFVTSRDDKTHSSTGAVGAAGSISELYLCTAQAVPKALKMAIT